VIAKICQLIGKAWSGVIQTQRKEGFWVASLQMANQIGLDAGLVSAICGSMFDIACHDNHREKKDIRFTRNAHENTPRYVWWFDLAMEEI
jgi:hypothetical protein